MKKLNKKTIEKIRNNKELKIELQRLLYISESTLYRKLLKNSKDFTGLSSLLLISEHLNEPIENLLNQEDPKNDK